MESQLDLPPLWVGVSAELAAESHTEEFDPARFGKASRSYATDWRCESDVVEVKCK